MNKNILTALCALLFIIGMIFFAYHEELIFFRSPFSHIPHQKSAHAIVQRKKITCFGWYNDTLRKEVKEILWNEEDHTQTIHSLISSCLSFLHDEQIIKRIVHVDNVTLNVSGLLFLSFDRIPFNKTMTVREKLLFIESLLKTLREADLKIQDVLFLVHYKTLNDPQLDFSRPWPISGFFLKNT